MGCRVDGPDSWHDRYTAEMAASPSTGIVPSSDGRIERP